MAASRDTDEVRPVFVGPPCELADRIAEEYDPSDGESGLALDRASAASTNQLSASCSASPLGWVSGRLVVENGGDPDLADETVEQTNRLAGGVERRAGSVDPEQQMQRSRSGLSHAVTAGGNLVSSSSAPTRTGWPVGRTTRGSATGRANDPVGP